MNAITIFPSIIKLELFSSLPSCNSHSKLPNEKLLIFNHIASKRKLTAVCSHQTRIGNLDAHLI
ncbi:hypothetical protein BvCmsSINP020_1882 [Escherichia coli]|nr:hypothetical protein BvCmsSINP020_1882 [Escherichia coli]